MKSSLTGRVKNTSLPKKRGLLPLFEAVVNSIEAIEDRFSVNGDEKHQGRIEILIRRDDRQQGLDLSQDQRSERQISSFEVTDNGIGFTNENWSSFQELDFTHKTERGCRGVGRLIWLKAFQKVRVNSWYAANGQVKARWFQFTEKDEVEKIGVPEGTHQGEIGSKVILDGFRSSYSKAVEKTAETIAYRLLEYLLWYFIRSSSVPKIIVKDDYAEQAFDLDSIFENDMLSESKNDDFTIKDEKFNITHVKLRPRNARKHMIAYCAAHRLIKTEKPDISGLSKSIADENGQFCYAGYVVGNFLDQHVYSERTDIDIIEESTDLLSHSEITLSDLKNELRPLAEAFLGKSLKANLDAGEKRLNKFIEQVAPQYLPIVTVLPEHSISVDPDVSDSQLEKLLHTKKYEVEKKLIEEGEKLLNPDLSDSYDDYKEKIADYLNELDVVKQSNLAAYVAHRRVVIDLLRKAMQKQDDGSYAREEVIHSLIMPMGKTSQDIESLRGSNLWLIDERLAFHQHYLGSNKSLASNPVTGATGGEKPDIMGLKITDEVNNNPHVFSNNENGPQPTITIVEIKRPMKNEHRTGEKTDPIAQAYHYLRKIRKGGVLDRYKRHIPNAEKIPAYVYVIADLTQSMKELCDNSGLLSAPDGLRYFGFNSKLLAYVEVIDYEGLLQYATERNSAFFEKLGLPSAST